MKKKLVLLVEGAGDVAAVPVLVKRLLTEYGAWDTVRLDPDPMRVGGIGGLVANDFAKWRDYLAAAGKSRRPDGLLMVLDGDAKKFLNQPFCVRDAAAELSKRALPLGAGQTFSTALVFAVKEFESWLIAGLEPLAGRQLQDGALVIPPVLPSLPPNLEESRDAKEWLRTAISSYRATIHQSVLAKAIDLGAVRQRKLRSFIRLESALRGLVDSFRSGTPVATP